MFIVFCLRTCQDAGENNQGTTIQTADIIGFIKLHYAMSNLFVGKQRHILPFAGQELCMPQVSIVPLKMYSYYVQSDHDAVVR